MAAPRNKVEDWLCESVSSELRLPVSEVRRAVSSFFDVLVSEARSLKLDDEKKIYTRKKFKEFCVVHSIPYIGRIGPSYSRYLSWRANEAKTLVQEPRSKYRSRRTQEDIERLADDILSGRIPQPVTKRRGSEMYNRVWLVGQEGKTLARQVIPKKKENVYD